MKKRMFVIAALILALAILGTGTLAYFTTRAVVHNVITTGAVDITLVEDFPGADANHKLEGVMPGGEYRKAVKVRNEDEEAWIRVRVNVTANKGTDPSQVLNIDFNQGTGSTQWTADGEWFYYNSPVKTRGETSYLFEKVTFSGPDMGNEYQGAEFNITVDAQAVQTKNNPIPAGGNVTDIPGWPDAN